MISPGLFHLAYVYADEQIKLVVGFSLDSKARKHLLASCGFTNIMQLAADNQPLTKVRPESLARYFVPELVFEYVAKTKRGALPINPELEEAIFDLSRWDVGVS